MPMTPGYYMPNLYGNAYYPQASQTPAQMPQQSYTPMQQPQNQSMIWVDGEVGAKAFQMPQGWPSGSPIALWDTNDTVIYLKSVNQMGMPNPLQKLHYTMEETQQAALPVSGTVSAAASPDSDYVTKEDFERQMKELKDILKNTQRNQNNGNRGEGK